MYFVRLLIFVITVITVAILIFFFILLFEIFCIINLVISYFGIKFRCLWNFWMKLFFQLVFIFLFFFLNFVFFFLLNFSYSLYQRLSLSCLVYDFWIKIDLWIKKTFLHFVFQFLICKNLYIIIIIYIKTCIYKYINMNITY